MISLFLRGDNSVRGKLDGPLLHMLNELRKEVSQFYPSVMVVTCISIARISCLFYTNAKCTKVKRKNPLKRFKWRD